MERTGKGVRHEGEMGVSQHYNLVSWLDAGAGRSPEITYSDQWKHFDLTKSTSSQRSDWV